MSNKEKNQNNKTDEEWRNQLSQEEYRVARQQRTEPAFSGKYYNHKENGTYQCICCGTPLFRSDEKFDSGTGWPSYTAPIATQAISEHKDPSHGMARVEVRCANCEAHLGHVFNDGPQPDGLRYCINSTVLAFKKP